MPQPFLDLSTELRLDAFRARTPSSISTDMSLPMYLLMLVRGSENGNGDLVSNGINLCIPDQAHIAAKKQA